MPRANQKPVIRFGQQVDTYLKKHSALAQAVNPDTILINSRIFAMRPADRRLVLLHELAHLHQLSTPGNDPVRALEAEAWDAAHAWADGKSCRIRGKARGRLNAVAIIQGGPKGHPHAPPWYEKSPLEPIDTKNTISVSKTVLIEKITFEAILDNIIAAKATEVVIVNHGDGSGLALPVMAGSTAGAERPVMTFLAADRSHEEAGPGGTKIKTPIKSDKDVADLTRLSEQQVKAIRVKMNEIRAMKLKHVAFRACNMGIKQETLEAFRDFFGAASVSAPREFDSYGHFSPSIGEDVEAWAKSKRKKGYHVSIDDKVAFGTKLTDSPTAYTIIAMAPSKDAFRAWVNKHIVDGGWGSKGVIFHGIYALHPAPTDPIIHFVRDAAFAANLVNYAG